MQATRRIWAQRRERALARLKRGTTESPKSIRERIWERDGGRCQICGIDLEAYPQLVTLGHLVDRACGGSDSDLNLEIECEQCNRALKPHHSSLEEYFSWRDEFQSRMMVPVKVAAPEPQPEPVEEKHGGWFSRFWRGKRGAA